jgi:hypothetical protein
MTGFVAISRALWDDPDFRDCEMSQREAWIWMIAHATWKPRSVRVGSVKIELARGQLAYSTRYLAKIFVWSEARVRRYLKVIEERSQIDAASDAGVTVITIRNYDTYQTPPDRGDAPNDAVATQGRRTSDASKNKDNQDIYLNTQARGEEDLTPKGEKITRRELDEIWSAYPEDGRVSASLQNLLAPIAKAVVRAGGVEPMKRAVSAYAVAVRKAKTTPFSIRRFLDPAEGLVEQYCQVSKPAPTASEAGEEAWFDRMKMHGSNASLWLREWGPEPGQFGCLVPQSVLDKFHRGDQLRLAS